MKRKVDETNASFANAINLALSVSTKASARNGCSEVADVLRTLQKTDRFGRLDLFRQINSDARARAVVTFKYYVNEEVCEVSSVSMCESQY